MDRVRDNLAVLVLFVLVLTCCTGCVRMLEAAYYAPPKPPEPCEVEVSGPIVHNPDQRACISHEHTQEILREMQGDRP